MALVTKARITPRKESLRNFALVAIFTFLTVYLLRSTITSEHGPEGNRVIECQFSLPDYRDKPSHSKFPGPFMVTTTGDASSSVRDPINAALQELMTTRVCGSPAVDGYAHVKPECLRSSPTARWWLENQPDPVIDLITHIEHSADYDGVAVAWGINNKKESIEDCAKACRDHKPNPDDTQGYGALPCNAFAYCSSATCFEPDAHKHSRGDCWLKFTEAPASPEVNMRGALSEAQRKKHPTAPKFVQWDAGVLLPTGVKFTNGTWSPRYYWL